MSSDRPLPTVIGPTENALRAVLARTLGTGRIRSYRSWVIINGVASADPARTLEDWRLDTADALKIQPREVDAVTAELQAAGLLEDHSLTELGRSELQAARSAVAASTAHLVAGLGAEEQETTRRVLDHIRRRAEALLAADSAA